MVTNGAPLEEEKLGQEVGESWDPGAALSSVPYWALLCYGKSVGTSQPKFRLRLNCRDAAEASKGSGSAGDS